MIFPRASTFEQGQQLGYGLAVGIAGIAFGLAILAGCSIIVFGHWAPDLQRTQLMILACVVSAGCLNTTIVIVGLLLGGPVGRIDVKDGSREIDAGAKAPGQ